LTASDFELLNNSSVSIRNKTASAVSLIGLDSLINGTVDLDAAFANVPADQFHILVAHCPDTYRLEDFPIANVDLMLCGHSHAAQIYLPLIGSLSTDEGAKSYNHGKHTINNMTLHITNGIGTSTMDMRLFSPPQMIVYRLRNEKPAEQEEQKKEQTPAHEKESSVETPKQDNETKEPAQ